MREHLAGTPVLYLDKFWTTKIQKTDICKVEVGDREEYAGWKFGVNCAESPRDTTCIDLYAGYSFERTYELQSEENTISDNKRDLQPRYNTVWRDSREFSLGTMPRHKAMLYHTYCYWIGFGSRNGKTDVLGENKNWAYGQVYMLCKLILMSVPLYSGWPPGSR